MGRVSVKMRCRERVSLMRWPESPDEIVVRDGHLTIKLFKLDGGWYAQVESSLEGKIFEGRVTEMSGLLAHPLVGIRSCWYADAMRGDDENTDGG